jgi:hypothetical protein
VAASLRASKPEINVLKAVFIHIYTDCSNHT